MFSRLEFMESPNKSNLNNVVIPAKAGIQKFLLDASFRWHDGYILDQSLLIRVRL